MRLTEKEVTLETPPELALIGAILGIGLFHFFYQRAIQ